MLIRHLIYWWRKARQYFMHEIKKKLSKLKATCLRLTTFGCRYFAPFFLAFWGSSCWHLISAGFGSCKCNNVASSGDNNVSCKNNNDKVKEQEQREQQEEWKRCACACASTTAQLAGTVMRVLHDVSILLLLLLLFLAWQVTSCLAVCHWKHNHFWAICRLSPVPVLIMPMRNPSPWVKHTHKHTHTHTHTHTHAQRFVYRICIRFVVRCRFRILQHLTQFALELWHLADALAFAYVCAVEKFVNFELSWVQTNSKLQPTARPPRTHTLQCGKSCGILIYINTIYACPNLNKTHSKLLDKTQFLITLTSSTHREFDLLLFLFLFLFSNDTQTRNL